MNNPKLAKPQPRVFVTKDELDAAIGYYQSHREHIISRARLGVQAAVQLHGAYLLYEKSAGVASTLVFAYELLEYDNAQREAVSE